MKTSFLSSEPVDSNAGAYSGGAQQARAPPNFLIIFFILFFIFFKDFFKVIF